MCGSTPPLPPDYRLGRVENKIHGEVVVYRIFIRKFACGQLLSSLRDAGVRREVPSSSNHASIG